MNKNLLIGGLAVILIAAVAFGVSRKGGSDNKTADQNGVPSASANAGVPIIQIASGAAYTLDASGAQSKELKNGDALTTPVTIKVSDGGAANVSFADGSVARIAGGTTLTVKSASYDKSSGKANASIFVKIGRVWSKVIELTTPDSSWEVETSNAVATVRGTAFDTNVTADATAFAGSEHDVTVAPIDPATHARMDAAVTAMGEGKMIEIKNSVLAEVIAGRVKLVAADLADSEKQSEWFSKNESDDANINTILEEIRARGVSGAELQNEIRAKLRGETGSNNDQSNTGGTEKSTLADLLKGGKSQKCTFSYDYGQGKSEGTIYLGSGKMRGDFKVTIAAGVTGAAGANMTVESHMMRDNDWTYVWTSASPQGFKMQTTDNLPDSLGGSGQSFDYNQAMNYNCSGWSGDSATFALPSGMSFMPLSR